jgi:hypothetical protein
VTHAVAENAPGGKKAEKKAAEEAEKVRSSPALDVFGLRRTASDTMLMRWVATSFSFAQCAV